jgi:regulator of nonsense transcripts 1
MAEPTPLETSPSLDVDASKAVKAPTPCRKYQASHIILHTFPVMEVFVDRHEQGTMIEMDNEELALKNFNSKNLKFEAWPIAPIPGLLTPFSRSWLVLVKPPSASEESSFPSMADRFTVDFLKEIVRDTGTFTLYHLPASRVPNPYEDAESAEARLRSLAAFKVEVPRSWKSDAGDDLELNLMEEFQVGSSIDQLISLDSPFQHITIRFPTNSITYDAELAALWHLAVEKRIHERRPSEKSLLAFQTILDFRNTPKTSSSLHRTFPHLKNPADPCFQLPQGLVDKFLSFNDDHRAALEGLSNISNGLYFVNGCPGAGKTEWNMVVSALIQARQRPGSARKRSPILFLVDLNKTVDDAADRYFQLCRSCGLKNKIIRMHGWPYEMSNSSKLNTAPEQQMADSAETESDLKQSQPDFTKKFLTTFRLAVHSGTKRNQNKAPTLDEAAWEHYEYKKKDYSELALLLGRMDKGEAFSTDDWKSLRRRVCLLYRAVLCQADFVATTPVATFSSFSRLFRPEVVFIDEAPHARELTTLIPIAFFEPLAWIFTGDVNQTEPFVRGGHRQQMEREGLKYNAFARQLRMSTMARAAKVGAIDSWLLTNTRAHGNLHRLPSKLFYHGRMVSNHGEEAMYPPSTLHLKSYLENLGTKPTTLGENRIVVELKDSREDVYKRSYWNPTNHRWILAQVERLLGDTKFTSVINQDAPGSIMIQTPYSTALRQYNSHVRTWPESWQSRVRVLTVDTAQGNQADVVFLDMVRTTKVGFMDDPKRLNVAITRARQAEVIVMHSRTNSSYFAGQRRNSRYTSQIWDDAEQGGRILFL